MRTIAPYSEPFLLYANRPEATSRIIAFSTELGLRRLATATTIFTDGNFPMAPAQFSQVCVLRVPFCDVGMRCVYALPQNKSRSVNDELFQAVVDKCEEYWFEMDVQTVITAFEDGVPRAVAGVFGRDVQSKACFYHVTQSTWRKVQQLGLINHYRDNERERNVLFNDALNTFYLRLNGVRHMVKYHSDSEKGNPLPPHRLLLSINSKGYFICTIPQTG